MATIRYIDTSDLPKGFDVADLIESGVTGADLAAWCRARVRDGLPPQEAKPRSVNEKSPGIETEAGAQGVTLRREKVQTTVAMPTAASSPVPVVVQDGNVARIERSLDPEPDLLLLPPEYSDDALADTFSEQNAHRMVYVAPWGRWMEWNNHVWKHDETLEAVNLARGVCRKAANDIMLRSDLGSKQRGMATQVTSMRTISNVERLARTDRRHAAGVDQWDGDMWSLNTPGGIVNLQTGDLRPARRDDFVTKSTEVAPGGACPNWLNFLKVATDGDDDLVDYLRRVVGYCLTGSTREHAFFFVYGTGGNGKGTFLNMVEWLLGDYTRTAGMDMFIEQKFEKHSTDLARLMGARMVTAQETEEGKRWNESRLKTMTGGDRITARFMNKDNFTYLPQFKIVMAGNHKPQLRNVDEAIKRRLHLIPFTVTIPPEKRDRNLADKLRAEASGILQWAIEGCLDWQTQQLAAPERVLAATNEYFESEDRLGQFLMECCEFDSFSRTKTSLLFSRYGKWCEAGGEYALPRKRWTDLMKQRGIESVKVSGDMFVEGVKLRSFIEAAGPGMPDF